MSIIKRRYDKNYFENFLYKEGLHSQRNRRRLTELLEHKDNGDLFELGCGTGGFLIEAGRYFDTKGLEVSEYAAQKANALLDRKVLVGDIRSYNPTPNVWDVVVAFNIFEHLENPFETIQKCYFGLREGGVLIGSVPNNFGIVGGLSTLVSNIVDKTHCSTYPPDFWHRSFMSVGFAQVKLFGEITLGRNRCIYVKNSLWKLLSFNLVFVCIK